MLLIKKTLLTCSQCFDLCYLMDIGLEKNIDSIWEVGRIENVNTVSVSLNPASTDGIQKRVVFKSKKGPRLVTTMPLSVKVKPQRVPTPSRTAENIPDSIMDLKENYSMN
ncbi:hypothetical protein EXN66_Car006283 [Channa argus]|uniref:Uncharacterized protein n=1 Tax=Channa argus TaxID=215402 RepID=A0A6G1PJY5_CHAAH|nr:hypothetical protein EXN66_Car006283 [Channa argus]